jgi:Mrp family chromosome partitioning ATPase
VLPVARRPVVADDRGLRAAIDELAERFDVLLLDLPPLLETSDGLTLSRLCDGYLLVVRHGVTTQTQIRQAFDELSGAVCLGVVVNRYRSSVPPSLSGVLGR